MRAEELLWIHVIIFDSIVFVVLSTMTEQKLLGHLIKLLPHLAAASAEDYQQPRIFIHRRANTNISAFGGHRDEAWNPIICGRVYLTLWASSRWIIRILARLWPDSEVKWWQNAKAKHAGQTICPCMHEELGAVTLESWRPMKALRSEGVHIQRRLANPRASESRVGLRL